MAQVRVRAVANVMGLRRGDTGDVETGSTHVDAMIDRGYLQILEYLPDIPEPRVPRAAAVQFAAPRSFGDAEVINLPEEVLTDAEPKPSTNRSRPSRARSTTRRRPTGDTGDAADAREGVSDGASGHGESAGAAPDGEAQQ